MAALTLFSFLLAWATWYWVEQAFRKRANPLLRTQRNVFAASGVIGAAFVIVGLAGHITNGFEWRLTAAERQLYLTAAPSPMRNLCHYKPSHDLKNFEFCTYFGDRADVAIYGNSHAVELAYGLADVLRVSSRSITQFSISNCPPGFLVALESYCTDFYEDRLQYLVENLEIKHVVLAYRAENARDNTKAVAIVQLANFLIGKVKNVVLILQAPTLQADISASITRSFISGEKNVAARTTDEWRKINQILYEKLDDLSAGVHVVDVSSYFCDAVDCYAIRNGNALYFDRHHMSIYGAKLVAKDIVRLLE